MHAKETLCAVIAIAGIAPLSQDYLFAHYRAAERRYLSENGRG